MREFVSALLLVPILSASYAKYDGARVHYESYGDGETVTLVGRKH